MRDFFVIFTYNFKDAISKRFFKIFTVLVSLFILIALLVPDFIFKSDLFKKKNQFLIYIVDNRSEIFKEHLSLNIFSIANKELVGGEYYFKLIKGKTKKDLDKELEERVLDGYIYVNDKKDIDIVTSKDLPELKFILDRFIYKKHFIKDENYRFVNYNVKSLQKENLENTLKLYILPVFLMFLMYLFFVIYGQFISFNINIEKNSKLIDIFLTKVKIFPIILGKVFGILSAGMVQMLYFILFSSFIFNIISEQSFPIVKKLFSVKIDFLFTFFIYFALGFILYGFFFSLIGGIVKRTEELSVGVIPVIFFISSGYFLGMISIGDSHSSLINILKGVPFFTPFINPFINSTPINGIILILILISSILCMIIINTSVFKYLIRFKGKKR